MSARRRRRLGQVNKPEDVWRRVNVGRRRVASRRHMAHKRLRPLIGDKALGLSKVRNLIEQYADGEITNAELLAAFQPEET